VTFVQTFVAFVVTPFDLGNTDFLCNYNTQGKEGAKSEKVKVNGEK
jgi:hypothetical protein